MKPQLPNLLLLGAAAAALTSVASAQSIVYRETFSNTGNANVSYGNIGWNLYWNQSGTSTTAGTAVNRTNPGTTGNPGNLTGAAVNFTAVAGAATTNIGQQQAGSGTGFAFVGATDVTAAFAFTTEYNGTSAITTSNIQSISFVQGNSAAATFRAAVQVGGTWYVTASQSGNTMTAAQFAGTLNPYVAGQGVALTFDLTSASWSALDFTPGSALSVGASTTLPTGTVTAFGYFVTMAGGTTVRVDDFSVSVIPEPSSFAALAGLAGLGMAASRRRRR